jgi:5-methylcytosine-specific restriction endonuclease McrA
MNRWKIPKWLEEEVRKRDKFCVYCGVKLREVVPRNGSRKSMATWEHIINDANIVNRKNIALCCAPCNSSKGTKALTDWIKSDYCKKRGITKDTVSKIVRYALRRVR